MLRSCAGGFLGYAVGEVFAEEGQGGEYGGDDDGEGDCKALGEKTADIGDGVLEAKVSVAQVNPISNGNESQQRHSKADKCAREFQVASEYLTDDCGAEAGEEAPRGAGDSQSY